MNTMKTTNDLAELVYETLKKNNRLLEARRAVLKFEELGIGIEHLLKDRELKPHYISNVVKIISSLDGAYEDTRLDIAGLTKIDFHKALFTLKDEFRLF